MITRLQFFIGVIAVLMCTNFLAANSLWQVAVDKNILSQAAGERWYFNSIYILFPSLIWGIRELFKDRNILFFIVFDLFLNFALLGFIAQWVTDNTKYFASQYVAAFISLIISIWQYNRAKNKPVKR